MFVNFFLIFVSFRDTLAWLSPGISGKSLLFPPYERENAAVYIAVSDGEYINTIIWLLKNAIAGIVVQRISVISHSDRKGGKDFQYKR